jgi:competence transcription factor ComK
MIFVKDAKYIEDYKVRVIFTNNKDVVIDLHDTIVNDHRPIFLELADKHKFMKFQVKMDTMVWDNGLDIAPEYLYDLALKNNSKNLN